MRKINHQIKQIKPNWDINYLFIGTFNPEGGKSVPYYYGREKNNFWKLISILFEEEINVNDPGFFEILKKHKIACIDIINSIEKNDGTQFNELEKEQICGRGYSDSVIISNKFIRNYNTELINEIINSNKNTKVFSTWGKGQALKDWNNELLKISFNANLLSPSPAARVPKGVKKFEYVLDNWKKNILK